MRKTLYALIGLAMFAAASAQYPIGHRSISYQDPARGNRDVETEIYYPGVSTGDNVGVATGQFPLLVFGHGFVMGYDAYLYWKDQLVPAGYFFVLPKTEGGASPDHAEFGADLAFLVNKLQSENANSASPFYQKLTVTSAIMGHSMGGGSAFLACENNTVPTCMVTFAAANTTPSAIQAAQSVSIPALLMTGADDCVTPPADHQLPMYNALASPCKVYVSINDGVHCFFGNYNFNCTLGESFCNPVPSITREKQLAVSLAFVRPFLDHFLKSASGAWAEFQDSLDLSGNITHQISCASAALSAHPDENGLVVYPNPAGDHICIEWAHPDSELIGIRLLGLCGEMPAVIYLDAGRKNLSARVDIGNIKPGFYILEITTASGLLVKKVRVLR